MSRRKRRKQSQRADSAAAAATTAARPAAHNPFAAKAQALRSLLASADSSTDAGTTQPGDTPDTQSPGSGARGGQAASGAGGAKANLAAPATPPAAGRGAAEADPAALDDEALFAAALGGDVAPIRSGRTRAPRKRPPRVAPPTPEAEHNAAAERRQAAMAHIFDLAERPCWPPAGRDEGVDALLRGSVTPDHSVDLHGMRVDQALDRVKAALGEAQQRRWRCLRLIHGRGRHSQGDAVLGPAVRSDLRRHPATVRAWCEAMESDGGAGATLVLLHRANKGRRT